MSSPKFGSVVFDLTFLNEVSKQHETIKDIHAQVLDSCIAIIVGRSIVRENHLVRKIPLYFNEIPNIPLVAQRYSDTLRSLSALRTDHPHVPQERRRPHVEL